MFSALVWNLLLTTALALLLAGAGRLPLLSRRPALRHTLWLLLLFKLITPPLILVPLFPPVVKAPAPAATGEPIAVPAVGEPTIDVPEQPPLSSVGRSAPVEASSIAPSEPTVEMLDEPSAPSPYSYLYVLAAVSLAGTCVLVAIYIMHAMRMGQWLRRFGVGDPTLTQACSEASAALGIRTLVNSRVVDARTVPLLWGWRRPVVVVPRRLVEQLPGESLRCIVTHELAHYVRRDHWSNLFALGVRAVFWWNPIAWWAYHEIRAAQESCCDAVAIACAPSTRQTYASTLLKALDFAQAESPARWGMALQIGSRRSILRRFEMIGRTDLNHVMSRWTVPTLLLLMIPLFCLPVRSQERESVTEVVDQSLITTDAEVTAVAEQKRETDKPRAFAAGNAKHIFLSGITVHGEAAEAWIVNRTSKDEVALKKGSTFKVADRTFSFEAVERRGVLVRADEKILRWKIGMSLRELLASNPVDVAAKDPDASSGTERNGKESNGALTGPVQIEVSSNPEVMILRGNREDLERVTALIRKLNSGPKKLEETGDEETNPRDTRMLETYPIVRLEPQGVLRTLQTILDPEVGTRMDFDEKSGRLIVYATRDVHEQISKLLIKLGEKQLEMQKLGLERRTERLLRDVENLRLDEIGDHAANRRAGALTKTIRFDFRYQPWDDVVRWFAKTAGLSLVTDVVIPGTLNYSDDKAYTVTESLDLLSSMTLPKGYVLIARGRMLHVVDLEDGVPAELIPRVKLQELPKRGQFEFVTVILPLGNANVEQVTPLLSAQGRAIPIAGYRELLITDRVAVIRTIEEVLTSKRGPKD